RKFVGVDWYKRARCGIVEADHGVIWRFLAGDDGREEHPRAIKLVSLKIGGDLLDVHRLIFSVIRVRVFVMESPGGHVERLFSLLFVMSDDFLEHFGEVAPHVVSARDWYCRLQLRQRAVLQSQMGQKRDRDSEQPHRQRMSAERLLESMHLSHSPLKVYLDRFHRRTAPEPGFTNDLQVLPVFTRA